MPKTAIAPELLTAYLTTRYTVQATPPFVVMAGQANPELNRWMERHCCHSAAYITACNPYSQPLDDTANAVRQRQLVQWIEARGLPYAQGTGESSDGSWKPEPSYLVGGVSLQDAQTLGQQLAQNALIWCEENAFARLILLR